jgi:hypothetical protein
VWIGFIWLRIGISGQLLWTRWWTFIFCKWLRISRPAEWIPGSTKLCPTELVIREIPGSNLGTETDYHYTYLYLMPQCLKVKNGKLTWTVSVWLFFSHILSKPTVHNHCYINRERIESVQCLIRALPLCNHVVSRIYMISFTALSCKYKSPLHKRHGHISASWSMTYRCGGTRYR